MELTLATIIVGYYCYTVALAVYIFLRRKSAVVEGKVPFKYFKDYQGKDVPKELTILNNHLNNQFQVPTIFYVAGGLHLALKIVSLWSVIFAVIFVVSRVIHSYVHIGNNNVLVRAKVYALGLIAVMGLWFSLLWSLAMR